MNNVSAPPDDRSDWLTTDSPVTPTDRAAQWRRDLQHRPEPERQAIQDWLELDDHRADPIPPEIEQTVVDHLSDAPAQSAVIAWLMQSRAIMASSRLSAKEKLTHLIENQPSGNALDVVKIASRAAVASYQKLPMGLQIAVPATLLATPWLGGAGVGIAAFGGAIGLPALLVFFLGVSGITSVIADLLKTHEDGSLFVQGILALIATDAALWQLKQATREAIVKDITMPYKQPMPTEQAAIHAKLLAMAPNDFERHVMSLFGDAGMTAWVTPAGSDAGIDGVAKDGQRVILVQCKRYAVENSVGRPAIQQFKGVLEENAADLGVFVTTSGFTAQARESAAKTERLVLIDGSHLVRWQIEGVALP